MAKPSVKQKGNKSNVFVRAINKFSNLHAPAKILILALVIGGFAGGTYSVYISSAAGWTLLYSNYNSNKSMYYTMYACKYNVPKKGYKIKARAYTGSKIGTQPKGTTAYAMGVVYIQNNTYYTAYGSDISPSSIKPATYLYSPTSQGYAKLDTKFKANLLEETNDGTLNSSIRGDYFVSTLSTCP